MSKLGVPEISTKKHTIVDKFQEVCVGLTILSIYSIVWLLIGALGYKIFLWLF
jgi:hypothetical protein